RPGRDVFRIAEAVAADGDGELGDDAGRGDAADLSRPAFGEPEGAVRPGRDARRRAADAGDGELVRDRPVDGDAADLVRTGLGEPEGAVRAGGDVVGTTPGPG